MDEEHDVGPFPNVTPDDITQDSITEESGYMDPGQDHRLRLRILHHIRTGRVNRQKRGYARPSG